MSCDNDYTHIPLQTLGPNGDAAADFLEALLAGSDTSSTPASPLWSPCTSDNAISDDPLTDAAHSPYPACCSAFPAFDTQPFLQHPPLDSHLTTDERKADVSIDLGENISINQHFEGLYGKYSITKTQSCMKKIHEPMWKDIYLTWAEFCDSPAVSLARCKGWEAADLQDPFGITYYLSTKQSSGSQTVTVRDLLLSNLGQKVRKREWKSL